jgi:hypothetical protein
MSKITRVLVTSETELEIHIPDHLLTNEALAEFSSGMFHVDGPADMYRYVASQLAARPYPHFIEGVGPAEFMEQPLSTAVEHSRRGLQGRRHRHLCCLHGRHH